MEKRYRVFFEIPWVWRNEDGVSSQGSCYAITLVSAFNRKEAKMLAIQKTRKDNRGVFWIKNFNKNPFKCVSRITELENNLNF